MCVHAFITMSMNEVKQYQSIIIIFFQYFLGGHIILHLTTICRSDLMVLMITLEFIGPPLDESYTNHSYDSHTKHKHTHT